MATAGSVLGRRDRARPIGRELLVVGELGTEGDRL